jgi:hypothetical protein
MTGLETARRFAPDGMKFRRADPFAAGKTADGSAIVALGFAALVTLFMPGAWMQRIWPGWMWVVPLGAAIVTTYYLTPYFTR